MSQTAEELLIIYESEAEQWATYLHSVFTGPLSEAGICCYDISTVTSRRDDFLRLVQYSCKLLILSRGMLEGLCQLRRFFLARVLTPAARVVVLLCGVDSLTPLLDLVPLNGDECLQISSEQDAHEYLSMVTDIVRRGVAASAANINLLVRKPSGSEEKAERMQSAEAPCVGSSIVVVPSRVPCRSSMEVFILLKNEEAGSDAEVEFTGENQTLRVRPVRWNERILCVSAPDFPAGSVKVTVYSDGAPLSKAEVQYYSNVEAMSSLLEGAADPVDFMCQALQEPSVEKLDHRLSSMLLRSFPTGGFQDLQSERAQLHCADAPSFLHFAARYGLRSVSSLLLQCPGAERALQTADRHGQTPAEIAQSHGHAALHVLLRETLNTFTSADASGDAGVYETMSAAGSVITADTQKEHRGGGGEEEEEEIYAPLGLNDEYDTILKSEAAVIANRPPAPTPRPESTQAKEDRTPYITKVFQKKKTHADLYSLPTKQARGDRTASTYDALVPTQTPHRLLELQQRGAKAGSHGADGARRGADGVQQVMTLTSKRSKESRPRLTEDRADDDSVYDKINIVHHTPGVSLSEGWRGSQAAESDVYSKPLKGLQPHFFLKADKR